MKTRINPIGGRWSPWIGSILLVNFAVVCALKIIHGIAGDILWMSNLGLLIAGIGFVRRSTVVVCTALIGIGVFHGIWLVDCLTWLFSGGLPLGVTSYLQGADMSVWAAKRNADVKLESAAHTMARTYTTALRREKSLISPWKKKQDTTPKNTTNA